MPIVRKFNSTGEAYDASQTRDDIQDGDVLVVPSERVVGVLVEAWPTAVSEEHGEFHTLSDGYDWAALPHLTDDTTTDYSESVKLANAVLRSWADDEAEAWAAYHAAEGARTTAYVEAEREADRAEREHARDVLRPGEYDARY